MNRTLKLALCSLTFNAVFSIYYLYFALSTHSWWLLTLGVYYLILGIVRFFVLKNRKNQRFSTKLTGIMLMILSIPLAGTVALSLMSSRGQKHHMIVMLAIAVYSFTKITVATINIIKSRRNKADGIVPLRNIAFADAFVSIFALQRSMLVTFEGMNDKEILMMNGIVGTAVFIIVFLLGLKLLQSHSCREL